MIYEEFYRKASNGEGVLFARAYRCNRPKAIVQIVHDVAEHGGRYEEFAKSLVDNDFDVYISDIAGHGLSKQGHEGAFAMKKRGLDYIISDLDTLFIEAEKKTKPRKRILIGNGFGAMMSLIYACRQNHVDMLVLSGFMVNPSAMSAINAAISNHIKINGFNKQSEAIHTMIYQTNRMPGIALENQLYWLSSDMEELKKYVEDEDTGFNLASSSYGEILRAFKILDKNKILNNIKEIPIFIAGGGDDQLGKLGEAPKNMALKISGLGNSNVALKIYGSARHDLFHDISANELSYDIIGWMNRRLEE